MHFASQEALRDSAELVGTLTRIKPDFMDRLSDLTEHSVSNDSRLAEAYENAAWLIPKPSEGQRGVVLMIGNGGFETASSMLPPEYPFIVCDRSASNLFVQRIILETVRNHPTKKGFWGMLNQFGEDFDGLLSRDEADVSRLSIGGSYDRQQEYWGDASTVPYFLKSERTYRTARQSLLDRSVGFRHINLSLPHEVQAFADDLCSQNTQVLGANATNAYAEGWAGPINSLEFARRIPFHPDAVVMDSVGGGGLVSVPFTLSEWIEAKQRYARERGYTSRLLDNTIA